MARLKLAFEEQLEIDKLFDQKKASQSGNQFDALYVEAVASKKLEEDAPEEDLNAPEEDSAPETDEEPAPEEETPEEDSDADTEGSEPDEEEVAKEEIRNSPYNIVTEEIDENLVTIKDGLIYIGQSAFGVAKYFALLGIEYLPGIMSKLYKGVVYVLSRLTKLFVVGIYQLEKYIEKRKYAVANLKSQITSAKKALEVIQSKEQQNDLTDQKFTQVKTINMLKIGDDASQLSEHVLLYQAFLANSITELSSSIRAEFMGIKQLISYQLTASVKSPMTFMQVKPINLSMASGSIEGYQNNEEFTDSFHYSKTLPGDVVFIANLPKPNIEDLAVLKEAYHHSKLFLGFNQANFKPIETIDYMNVEQLSTFVDSLEKLSQTCEEHIKLYESILRDKAQLKLGLRNYIRHLSQSDDKVNLSDSLAEYIYLKTLFTEQVYIQTAMDVHEYAGRIIVAGLAFVSANIKRLS